MKGCRTSEPRLRTEHVSQHVFAAAASLTDNSLKQHVKNEELGRVPARERRGLGEERGTRSRPSVHDQQNRTKHMNDFSFAEIFSGAQNQQMKTYKF